MKYSAACCLQEPVTRTREIIPWWSDLSARAKEALTIPSIATDSAPGAGQCLLADHYDLIVVGAGVAGLSATLEAAKLGLAVLCLEAGSVIGLGATGRNAGILCAGINMPIARAPQNEDSGKLWLLTAQTLDEMVSQAKRPDSLLAATRRGGLGLATSRTALNRIKQEAKARTKAGLNAHVMDKKDVAKMAGGRLNLKNVQAAICYPDEGSIHPLTLLAQLAFDARRAGAVIVGDAMVVASEEVVTDKRPPSKNKTGKNSNWLLKLASGQKINAPFIIKAVGPTAAPTARIYALSFKIDLPSDFPVFWDAAPYVYYDFRAGDGRLTASGGRYAKVGGGKDMHYHKNMAAAARHWLPELAHHEPSHTWAVDIEVAHDLVPHLTPLGKAGQGFAVDGLGALGVLPGVVLGRQAARHLAKIQKLNHRQD